MSKKNIFVVICRSHQAAEKAVHSLQRADFDVRNVSIIGKDYFDLDRRPAEAGRERMKSLSDVMAFWGRIWKLLPGDAFIRLEATDSIIVAGPISDSMREAETDPSHFHTCNPLRACLFAAGISNENLAGYEAALKSGRYLVIVQGNRQEVPEAASILKSSGCFGVAKARKAELSALKRAARNPAKVMDKTSDPIPLQHE